MKFLKLSPRDINSVFALLSALLAIVVVVAMLFPEFINYEYSISKLSAKADSIESVAMSLQSNERMILSLQDDVRSKMEESEKVKTDADELKSRVNYSNFNLHIPSFLITLEESAKVEGIDMEIDYSQLKTNQGNFSEVVDVETPVGDSSTEDAPMESEPSQNPDTGRPVRPGNPNSGSNQVDNQIHSSMSVASVPVAITGDFMKVRDFIRLLDSIDFIEPAYIEITSSGDEVYGSLLLHIYYGEVR